MELKDYSDEELKVELKRRASLRRIKAQSIKRCRHCKFFGGITYFGDIVPEEKKRKFGIRFCCKFFKTKNNKYYRTHSPYDKACKFFEPECNN